MDGPALIEAYELESKVAHFPRVILSAAATALCHEQLRLNGGDVERHTLVTDKAGVTFVNYLSHLELTEEALDDSLDYLNEHRRHIEENLARLEDGDGVRAKYEWLAGYHDYFCTSTLREDLAKALLIGTTHPDAVFEPFGEDIPKPTP